MMFILQIFHFRKIREFLNSRAVFDYIKKAICNYLFSILARTLNSRGNEFMNISEN